MNFLPTKRLIIVMSQAETKIRKFHNNVERNFLPTLLNILESRGDKSILNWKFGCNDEKKKLAIL